MLCYHACKEMIVISTVSFYYNIYINRVSVYFDKNIFWQLWQSENKKDWKNIQIDLPNKLCECSCYVFFIALIHASSYESLAHNTRTYEVNKIKVFFSWRNVSFCVSVHDKLKNACLSNISCSLLLLTSSHL